MSLSTRHTRPPAIQPRKLAVLDLNGTLLFRPKPTLHRPREERPVHLRPFMPTFCRYLFHDETRSWLDTMIWSSAQPHNVAFMVHACFGPYQEKLVQVWARDRMDLDHDSYHKKVQTTKDLATVWRHFSSDTSLYPFSQSNTILIDDSVQKAARQPLNHICVREYEQGMRRSDARVSTDAGTSHDQTLLALVGILEDLKSQEDVVDWIRRGRTAATMPRTWFEDRAIMHHWSGKGREAADRLGITIEV